MLATHARVGELLSADTRYPEIEGTFPPTTSGWPIDRTMGRLLARLIIELDLHDVLEFGAGASSVVFAQALARIGGGRLTTVEEVPAWSVDQWAKVSSTATVDAKMIVSQVSFRAERIGLYHAYTEEARHAVAARGPYNLVLVDAPDGLIGRDGALHLAFRYLAPGALIIVDDAKRRKERDMMARWMAVYPGLSMLADAPELGHGTAVLGYSGDARVRLSARALVSSAVREAYAAIKTPFSPLPQPPASGATSGTAAG